MNQEELCSNYVEKTLEEKIPQDKQQRTKEMLRMILTDCFNAGVETGKEISKNEEKKADTQVDKNEKEANADENLKAFEEMNEKTKEQQETTTSTQQQEVQEEIDTTTSTMNNTTTSFPKSEPKTDKKIPELVIHIGSPLMQATNEIHQAYYNRIIEHRKAHLLDTKWSREQSRRSSKWN